MSNTKNNGTGPASCSQFGALCWRPGENGAEVLLISSRETGRWVIPKGWPMTGRSGPEAAAIEAWEEAGVTGPIMPDHLGCFTYDKILKRDTDAERVQPCTVEVYPLQVTSIAPTFPECDQRRRQWFAPEMAAQQVAEEELQALLIGFRPPLLQGMRQGGRA
ncbi:NUDIX hydrolase [Pseudorhodobacter sp.]|uniref:NUDIX hydrolase n=1 Tax=Pseudorhodobacter sp. TaxID=1934400 RepID=UPI002649062E|nr:NUDIX hydrolase [Pseudorhodobacter sp.]MDN5786454.1 NUDIX hydrolase [Pseudorhodobacter sp.]